MCLRPEGMPFYPDGPVSAGADVFLLTIFLGFICFLRGAEMSSSSQPMTSATHPAAPHGGSATLNDRARLAAFQYQNNAWPLAPVQGCILAIDFAVLLAACELAVASAPALWGLSHATQALALMLTTGAGLLFQLYRLSGLSNLGKSLPVMAIAVAVGASVLMIASGDEILARGQGPLPLLGWGAEIFGVWLVLRLFEWLAISRLKRAGKLQRRAVIVGGGQRAAELIQHLEKAGDQHILICGIFDDRHDDRSPPVVAGYQHLGSIDELVEFGRLAKIDLLIVTIPQSAEDRLLMMLKKLWVLPVDIRVSALGSKLRFHRSTYSWIGPVPCLALFDKPIDGWNAISKRVFDIFFASIAIVLLCPIMIGAAIAVRLDSKGPIIFRQRRYGYNNQVTEVYKFRSMYHEMADPTAKVVVTKNDPRVTRVGRIIRKTSIDELPQFFNVLQGRLSLVGPRPHAINAHTSNQLWEEVVEGYFARHKVKPGVTGWAQINGYRGEIDSKEKLVARVEHDLYYIEHWSVWFDLYVLFMTPLRIMGQENAY